MHITDGVGEITDHHYGEGFYDHSSIKAIQANKGIKGDEDCLSFKLTNTTLIEELLSKINTRKACGHDMLPSRFIRDSSRAIAGPIAKILNTSIAQSRYPSRWKMGLVTPLFKKDEELDKRNYRPVTVLPCLKNIFEKLLLGQIKDFYHGLLSDFISAYRRRHSCETALLKLTEDWRACRDRKELVAVVFIHLSKAFDTIPHPLLLAKLKAYGLSSSACALFADYLSGRSQRVEVGDSFS